MENDAGNNTLQLNFSFLQCQTYTEQVSLSPPEGDLGGWSENNLGGYSIGVPPLPIPNREVKPNHVDGTA